MILLSFHPLLQLITIILCLYALYLGCSRIQSLHFGRKNGFKRDRHAIVGTLALGSLMLGMAGGAIIVARYLAKPVLESLHGKGAMVLLPFILFGLFSGFYMYLNPEKRKIFPIIHMVNNIIVLLLLCFQLATGISFYLRTVSAL
jgi:hypothetical protein